jgi:hypothetical protein
LASYGLSNRDLLDLLLIDMNWSNIECLELIEVVKKGGEELNSSKVSVIWDDSLALAVSWSLVNAVC